MMFPVQRARCMRGAVVLAALCACSGDERSEPAREGSPPAAAAARRAPAVEPLPLDAAGRAWVDVQLAAMDVRARVAQLVFPWISGREVPDEAARLARWAG